MLSVGSSLRYVKDGEGESKEAAPLIDWDSIRSGGAKFEAARWNGVCLCSSIYLLCIILRLIVVKKKCFVCRSPGSAQELLH